MQTHITERCNAQGRTAVNIVAIVWVLFVYPIDGGTSSHDASLGGVFQTRELCHQAWREIPEKHLHADCVRRELWSVKK